MDRGAGCAIVVDVSLSLLVFSLDRAAQLELFLRSLREQAREFDDFAIAVLFGASDSESAAAYDEVAQANPEVVFQEEVSFEERSLNTQILDLIDQNPRPFFGFFVDDDVIIRPFSLQDAEFGRLADPSMLAVSLRLHPGVLRCQPLDQWSRPPLLGPNRTWTIGRKRVLGSKWLHKRWRRWTGFPRGDWACRFSLDGNIYATEPFRAHLVDFPEIAHVTKIEPEMSKERAWAEKLTCYAHPRLINLAMNRVDVHHAFPCAEVSVKEMNAQFRAGYRLDYRHLVGRRYSACHLVTEPVWTRR